MPVKGLKKMDIIFMGALVPPDQAAQMSGLSVAGNKFQYNIVKYLARLENVHIYVLSVLPLASFPGDKRIMIRKTRRKLWDNVEYFEIPYINIPVIKQLTQIRGFISCTKALKKDKPILLTMNLFPYNGCPFVRLQQRYGLKGAAILADLPVDENYSRKGLSRAFRRLYNGITAGNIKKCHDFIVLNEKAIKEYATSDAHYIVMEGGIDPEEIRESGKKDENDHKKRIIYSGALTDYSGVAELMEAMKYVSDESLVLEIYGSGKLAETVAQAAAENENIVFGGKVSNEDMLRIQSEAWLLVNPRPVEDPIARVTFPSKIFEYMVSGTPVLTTRLNGFTSEYYDKMFFTDSNVPSVLAEKISEISRLDRADLNKVAMAAREFVLKKKNWQCQTQKIYRFLAGL